MRTWLSWLMVSFLLVIVGSFVWTHRHHAALPPAEQQTPQSEATYAEAQEAQQMVTVSGPMADYVLRQKPSSAEGGAELSGPSGGESGRESSSEKPQPVAHMTRAAEPVGDSPVGTSATLLHKTFRVAGVVNSPFEIPAHASTPKLHGTYRSFVRRGGSSSSDSSADVEFLLLNQQQYADFLSGRPSDALFSADSAHDGEVNFSLPPTINQPAQYYLVFRNGSQGEREKVVQADFRVDF